MSETVKSIWLDVDPGHDDATAILLALHLTNIHLLGISTTHGNASSYHTALNAARCLLAFGGAERGIRVYPGASKPLLLPPRYAPSIHGPDGLGGVEGLPRADDPAVLALLAEDEDGKIIRALDGMAKYIRQVWQKGSGKKVTVVSCGPMTNVALFVSVYPDLVDAVEQFVFMGGGVGLGNIAAVAEFNILCDPHASQIVLDAAVPAVMIPLNVTHTAIVTHRIHWMLRSSKPPPEDLQFTTPLPQPSTPLRHTLSTLISFFADAYKSTFGFPGPPLHDPLTIVYVAYPELFKAKRYRVDVELSSTLTRGETVVDVWGYRECDDSWGSSGKNCIVTEALDVEKFFEIFFESVARCDKVSPLNQGVGTLLNA
ncbi:uridine nucleosidase [Rhodocollybia butyracea]|uniref:Uridine nucleosidase n=1 Tax=Rhodocollybia butyracea TaxID=206335 RepID=A0A9P5Q2S6_9AGAR|nr:uridine nucleosidase [Rhodocollybia butyracea]